MVSEYSGLQFIVLTLTDQFALRGNPPLRRRSFANILVPLPQECFVKSGTEIFLKRLSSKLLHHIPVLLTSLCDILLFFQVPNCPENPLLAR